VLIGVVQLLEGACVWADAGGHCLDPPQRLAPPDAGGQCLDPPRRLAPLTRASEDSSCGSSRTCGTPRSPCRQPVVAAMGYYNMPPAKMAADLNALEKLLRTLNGEGAIEALDLLEKITRNVVQNPSEDKYRRVRTTNEKLAVLFCQENCLAVMQEMGWQQDGDSLVLPMSVELDFPKHVVKILEAKSYYGKLKEEAKRGAKLAQDPSKAGVLHEMEIDRRERAAAQAVSSGPKLVAQAVVGMSEEQQLQAALRLSLQGAGASTAATTAPSPTPSQTSTPTPTSTDGASQKKPDSAFDFKRRGDAETKKKEGEMSLQDLRALQKEKFKKFEADPNAKDSEIYKRPAATGPGVKQEQSWYDWMTGASSSSSGGGGGGGGGGYGGGGRDNKPRMKTLRDLPPPVRQGGG